MAKYLAKLKGAGKIRSSVFLGLPGLWRWCDNPIVAEIFRLWPGAKITAVRSLDGTRTVVPRSLAEKTAEVMATRHIVAASKGG